MGEGMYKGGLEYMTEDATERSVWIPEDGNVEL